MKFLVKLMLCAAGIIFLEVMLLYGIDKTERIREEQHQ